MKAYFIDFIIQLPNGISVLSSTLRATSRSFDFARSILEVDLNLLEGFLSDDLVLVYDLSKIYCDGK